MKIVLLTVCVAALCFIGVSVYPPLQDFLSGKLLQNLERKTNPPAPVVSTPEPVASALPAPEPEPEPAQTLSDIRAVDSALLPSNQAQEVNAVVLELKDVSGVVLYNSVLEMATNGRAAAKGAELDLANTVRDLHAQGLQVVGRIYAFSDHYAPYADKMAAVRYMNTQWMWLDDAEADGGKPWLNPHSPIAQSYILDMALEALDAGVDAILLDGLQFPQGYGLHFATYGEWGDNQTPSAVLAGFVKEAQDRISQRGKPVFFCAYAPEVLNAAIPLEKYGGVNPAVLFGENLAIHVEPALFGSAFEAGTLRLENPALNPYETTQAVLKALQRAVPSPSGFFPLLQGYTDTRLRGAAAKTYTQVEIQAQIQAVQEAGLRGYAVLTAPTPLYPGT